MFHIVFKCLAPQVWVSDFWTQQMRPGIWVVYSDPQKITKTLLLHLFARPAPPALNLPVKPTVSWNIPTQRLCLLHDVTSQIYRAKKKVWPAYASLLGAPADGLWPATYNIDVRAHCCSAHLNNSLLCPNLWQDPQRGPSTVSRRPWLFGWWCASSQGKKNWKKSSLEKTGLK